MRKKKQTIQPAPAPPPSVDCPLPGHRHRLLLQEYPDDPGSQIAVCGKRIVYRGPRAPRPQDAEPILDYHVRSFEGDS